MVERRRRLRLSLKSQNGFGSRHFVWQELQRHKSVQVGVLGFIHHSHAATAQLFNYPIVRNR